MEGDAVVVADFEAPAHADPEDDLAGALFVLDTDAAAVLAFGDLGAEVAPDDVGRGVDGEGAFVFPSGGVAAGG